MISKVFEMKVDYCDLENERSRRYEGDVGMVQNTMDCVQ